MFASTHAHRGVLIAILACLSVNQNAVGTRPQVEAERPLTAHRSLSLTPDWTSAGKSADAGATAKPDDERGGGTGEYPWDVGDLFNIAHAHSKVGAGM